MDVAGLGLGPGPRESKTPNPELWRAMRTEIVKKAGALHWGLVCAEIGFGVSTESALSPCCCRPIRSLNVP